jgi:hypothetical protein
MGFVNGLLWSIGQSIKPYHPNIWVILEFSAKFLRARQTSTHHTLDMTSEIFFSITSPDVDFSNFHPPFKWLGSVLEIYQISNLPPTWDCKVEGNVKGNGSEWKIIFMNRKF